MRRFFILISFLLLACNRMAGAPTSGSIEASIRKVLPKGWTLTSSAGRVVISKDQEVTFYNAVAMAPGEDPQERVRFGNKGVFKIQLIIGPLLSLRDYSDIKQTLHQAMPPTKTGVRAQPLYSLNRDALPDVHGPDYSVYISTSRHPYMLVWPEDLNQEWQKVLQAIKGRFEEYK